MGDTDGMSRSFCRVLSTWRFSAADASSGGTSHGGSVAGEALAGSCTTTMPPPPEAPPPPPAPFDEDAGEADVELMSFISTDLFELRSLNSFRGALSESPRSP